VRWVQRLRDPPGALPAPPRFVGSSPSAPEKDPTLCHVAAALRSIDRALTACGDHTTRHELDEARATLSAVLSLGRATPLPGRGDATAQPPLGPRVRRDEVLSYIAGHPGSRCQDIAAAAGADTKAVRPLLKSLRSEGKVRSEGQARGTRYFVTAAQ